VDSFEWNKIAGGVLAAFLLMMIGGTAAGALFSHGKQEKPAYVPEGCEGDRSCGAGSAEAVATEKEVPLPNLLAAAAAMPDISAKGAAVFKQCTSCHTIDKGGKNGTGPNLFGIVGDKYAHMAGFPYSGALSGKSGEKWTWEAMNAWLKSPKAAVPGNKMSFAGIGNPEKRAQLLVYLNSNSDNPLPLPAAVAETAPAPAAAPADGAKPAEAASAAPADAAKPAEAATAKPAEAAAAEPAKK
jgi:cytochrome c